MQFRDGQTGEVTVHCVGGAVMTDAEACKIVAEASKPGRKPRVEVPADFKAWLDKHGLRVVPKQSRQ